MKRFIASMILIATAGCVTTHDHDLARFDHPQDAYLNTLKQKAGHSVSSPERELVVDWSTISIPNSPASFQQIWHTPPVCQDITGNCWAYSATSFLESEIDRQHGIKTRLSEIYIVYWEYVEKARRFIREKGHSRFSRGSMPNAARHIWMQYGVVPFEDYTGLANGKDFYDDYAAFSAMRKRLQLAVSNNQWNEEAILRDIRDILDAHFGTPPETITIDQQTITPQQYLATTLQIQPDDFIDVMSLMREPFNQQCMYDVPDNWWRSRTYLNLPLDQFTRLVQTAIDNGYTIAFGCDRSGPGYGPEQNAAIIPTFDIPAPWIDDAARQLRFDEGATVDDHALHMVGHCTIDNWKWYLVKDSETLARNGIHDGYFFFREDYVQLKVMNLLIHKDALKLIK